MYSSQGKFESRTGWPCFAAAADAGAVQVAKQGLFGSVVGSEVRCSTCAGRLGERFADGASFPGTQAARTGFRHCVNGAALTFVPDGGAAPVNGTAPAGLAFQQQEVMRRGGEFRWRMADGGLRPI